MSNPGQYHHLNSQTLHLVLGPLYLDDNDDNNVNTGLLDGIESTQEPNSETGSIAISSPAQNSFITNNQYGYQSVVNNPESNSVGNLGEDSNVSSIYDDLFPWNISEDSDENVDKNSSSNYSLENLILSNDENSGNTHHVSRQESSDAHSVSIFHQVISDKSKTFLSEEEKKEAELRLATVLKMFTVPDPKKPKSGEIIPGKPPCEIERQKDHMNLFYSMNK